MNRQVIVNALENVSSGISSSLVGGLVDQNQHYIFWKGRVRTFNDEILLTYPLDIGIEKAAVRLELFSLLKNTKVKEVQIEETEKEILIHSKKISAGVLKEDEIKSPAIEVKLPKEWKKTPVDLSEAVKFCLTSISENMSMPQFTAIHFNGRYVESSDNYRITRHSLSSSFEKNLLVAGRYLKEFVNGAYTQYAVNDNWIHFKNEEGKTYSCRVMKGMDFPDTKSMITKEGTTINLPKNLPDILMRTFVFTEEEKGRTKSDLNVKVTKGKIVLSTKNSYGWIQEKTKSDYKGDKGFKFKIASRFLLDALKLGCSLTIGERSACLSSDKLIHTIVIEKENI